MKKILAILLSTAMLVAMLAVCAIPASAAATSVSATFDTSVSDGSVGLLFNATDNAGAWWYHVSFKPASTAGQYEVVELGNPEGTSTGVAAMTVPANGFVWGVYAWPAAGSAAEADLAFVKTLSVGSIVAFTGIDVAAGTAANVTAEVVGVIPDIETEGNVAYQKSYVTSELYKADASWNHDPNAAESYPDENGKSLTDGVLPKVKAYTDVAWAGLHDGITDALAAGFSYVTIDLDGTHTLNKVVAYVAPELGDGVTTPAWMGLVGYDAEGNAFDIGEFVIPTASPNDAYVAVEMTLDDVVADKIEVRMTRGGYTFISEVAAYGVAGGEYPPADEGGEGTEGGEGNEGTEGGEGNEGTEGGEGNEGTEGGEGNEGTEGGEGNEGTEGGEGNEGTEGGEGNEGTEGDDEPTIEDIMGEANADAKFDVDIVAPEKYVPGETFSVDFVIKNIAVESGIDTVEFIINFDTTKLELAEELSGSAINVFNGFAEWEGLCVVNEDGTIGINAGTAGGDNGDVFTYAKADGEISFTIDFAAKADATGDALIYVANDSPMAYFTDDNGEYAGNGDYAYVAQGEADKEEEKPVATPDEPTADEPTADEPTDGEDKEPEAGDASSIIFFAIIALVAIAGSAVVIKTRR